MPIDDDNFISEDATAGKYLLLKVPNFNNATGDQPQLGLDADDRHRQRQPG